MREQVGYGADWIKFYADHGVYEGKPDRPVRSIVNFTPAEAAAIVDEAHRLGVKVAAHANGWDGIDAALRAGVDSIEHGQGLTDDLVDADGRAERRVVPDDARVSVRARRSSAPNPRAFMVAVHKAAVARAYKRGVRIVFGTDAGAFPWSMNPAAEAKLMVDAGMPRGGGDPRDDLGGGGAARSAVQGRARRRARESDVGVIARGQARGSRRGRRRPARRTSRSSSA